MKQKLYEGSSKTLYQPEEDFTLIMSFSDKITLDNGKIYDISGKGVLNNTISSSIMSKLDLLGIENHLIEKLNMREQLVQSVEILPVQLSITTVACGRYVTEFAIEEGYVFDQPIIDFRVKSRELGYPIINEHQIINFDWLNKKEISVVKKKAIRVYDFLSGLFTGLGIRLVECQLEFGRVYSGEEYIIMLADEISPDNCRLWDMKTNEKLGREMIEHNLQKAIKSYKLIADLLKERVG